MGSLARSVRWALRAMRSRPGPSVVAVLTLSLGIGANSALFTVVNGALFEPLPIRDPERVYLVLESNLEKGISRFPTSPANLADWQLASSSFESLAALVPADLTLTGLGPPERLTGSRVSAGYFAAIGLEPVVGRFFTAAEDRPGVEPVVVVGDGFWRRRYGADREVLGRTLTIDGRVHTIIGVAPSLTQSKDEVWVPLALDPAGVSRGSRFLAAVARLRPGVTAAAARAELEAVAARLARDHAATNAGWGVVLDPLQEQLRSQLRPLLLMLFAAVGLVLLIACANIAGLQLAKAAACGREIAVRAALGAGRLRLVGQSLVDNLIHSLLGGGLGLLLALAATRVLVGINAGRVQVLAGLEVDGRVLAFTLALSLATGLAFGLIPALAASRPALTEQLQQGGGRTATGGRSTRRLRSGLVVGEVALSLLLLIAAGLLLKSFARLQGRPLGFEPRGVLTAKVSLPAAKYGQAAERATFYRLLLERAAALPGVEAAAWISPLPVADRNRLRPLFVEGRPAQDPGAAPRVSVRVVTPGYFEAMGIPVLAGRTFVAADNIESPPVAIVNASLARRLWPQAEPIGRRVALTDPAAGEPRWLTVVGRVGDVRFDGPGGELEAEIYWPAWQDLPEAATFVVRAGSDPERLAGQLRSEVLSIDDQLPLYDVRTMEQVVAAAVERPRLTVALFGFFAALALILAAVGVYGLISHTVSQRVGEIGVRMALGARRRQVLVLLLRQGMLLVLAGLALGFAAAAALTRLLASLVHEVSTTDAAVFTTAVVTLAGVALVASLVPARRATRIDPGVTLRYD